MTHNAHTHNKRMCWNELMVEFVCRRGVGCEICTVLLPLRRKLQKCYKTQQQEKHRLLEVAQHDTYPHPHMNKYTQTHASLSVARWYARSLRCVFMVLYKGQLSVSKGPLFERVNPPSMFWKWGTVRKEGKNFEISHQHRPRRSRQVHESLRHCLPHSSEMYRISFDMMLIMSKKIIYT